MWLGLFFILGFFVGLFVALVAAAKDRDEANARFLTRMSRMNQKYQAVATELIRYQRGEVSAKQSPPS